MADDYILPIKHKPTVSFKVGKANARMLSAGDRICQSVLDGKPFEPQSLEKWGEMCAGRGTVLDIGAYTGLYSILARLLGCHAIAFEPMPFNRGRFRANCGMNRVSDKVNEEVVSDQCGETVITYRPIPYTSGASLLRHNGTQLPVRSVTIDSLNLPKCAAIKIDVERAEPMVLAGARETLARCRPALLVEVLGDDEKAAVMAAIEGYRVAATLDTRNWLMLPA